MKAFSMKAFEFSNLQFDEELGKFESRQNHQHTQTPNVNANVIKIYYKNQTSPSFKVNERVLKYIVKRNMRFKSDDDTVNLIAYYKNMKTSNLLRRNNLHAQSKLNSSNVIYEFKCPYEDCVLHPRSFCIGYTQITLSRRFTNNYYVFANCRISRTLIVENTTIIKKIRDFNCLTICEAMFIKLREPLINRQDTRFARTFKLTS